MLRESRVPHAILISKELDALWLEAAWLSYFLRVIVLWLQLRIDSSQEDSDTKGTLRILARSGLAVLLSTIDCIVASVENREFPKHIQMSYELDAFWPEAAWLSHFLCAIEMWLRPRVESSHAVSDT